MKNEIEATFTAVDKDVMRDKFKNAGFELYIPEYMMLRKVFDFSGIAPGRNKFGRVRKEADKITMTIKEIRGAGINDTFEVELVVNDFDAACTFFEECGMKMKSYQETLREVWTRDGIEATIDTWPGLKPFVEIEGESEEIVRKASQDLGFDFNDALFGSVDVFYKKELDIPFDIINSLSEITFANPPIKTLQATDSR